MNFLLLMAVNALVLVFMYHHFKNRIEKRLSSEGLWDELRKEVGSIIQELNRTTDRNIGLIEDKITLLKEFLDSADKRILLMRRESEKHEVSAKVYSQIVRKQEAAPESDRDAPRSVDEVMDLYRKGISADLIAGRLGMPVGEVELMIALRDGKH